MNLNEYKDNNLPELTSEQIKDKLVDILSWSNDEIELNKFIEDYNIDLQEMKSELNILDIAIKHGAMKNVMYLCNRGYYDLPSNDKILELMTYNKEYTIAYLVEHLKLKPTKELFKYLNGNTHPMLMKVLVEHGLDPKDANYFLTNILNIDIYLRYLDIIINYPFFQVEPNAIMELLDHHSWDISRLIREDKIDIKAIIKKMNQKGANVNFINKNHENILNILLKSSTLSNNRDIFETLIKLGANVNQPFNSNANNYSYRFNNNPSMLYFILTNKDIKDEYLIKLFIKAGAKYEPEWAYATNTQKKREVFSKLIKLTDKYSTEDFLKAWTHSYKYSQNLLDKVLDSFKGNTKKLNECILNTINNSWKNSNEIISMIDTLIKLGADLTLINNSTLISQLISNSRRESNLPILKYLINKGIDINGNYEDSPNILFYIVKNIKEDFELYDFLIKNGIDYKTTDSNGKNILYYCCIRINYNSSSHFINLLEYFIKLGIDINQKDNKGNTLYDSFKEVVTHYDFSDTLKFIDLGYDINTQNKNGDTILHNFCQNYLSEKNCIKIFKLDEALEDLLNRKANILLKNKQGKTPLDYLKVSIKSLESIEVESISKILLKFNIIKDIKEISESLNEYKTSDNLDYKKFFAIAESEDFFNENEFKKMLQQGYDINYKDDEFGNTILAVALFYHNLDIINFILKQPDLKIDTIWEQNRNAVTLLSEIDTELDSEEENKELLIIILEIAHKKLSTSQFYNFINHKDVRNLRAIDYAKRHKPEHEMIIEVLLSYGADE